MAKPELGTKRLCGSCGAKFYDLSKSPIVCPKCGTIFEVVVPVARAKPDAMARAGVVPAAAAAKAEVETAETQDAEFVSLEDADAETEGKKAGMTDDVDLADDDVEVADDDEMDDAALIEEEEGDADVTDIIGDGIEKEEET